MVILRLLSYVLVAATLMLLGHNAIHLLQHHGEPMRLYSLAEFINDIAGSNVTEGLPAPVKMVFSWPSWAITGVTGLILAFVSRGQN